MYPVRMHPAFEVDCDMRDVTRNDSLKLRKNHFLHAHMAAQFCLSSSLLHALGFMHTLVSHISVKPNLREVAIYTTIHVPTLNTTR